MKAIDPKATHEIKIDDVTYIVKYLSHRQDRAMEDFISENERYKPGTLATIALNFGLVNVIGLEGLEMQKESKPSYFGGIEYTPWTDDTLTSIPKEHLQRVSTFILSSGKMGTEDLKN